jgi:hypothetical protein
MEDAYEAVGLRDTGDVYTVEILGRPTRAAAIDLAQRWAEMSQATTSSSRCQINVCCIGTSGSSAGSPTPLSFRT